MQDSGSGWPLWPRWGTSLSSPDVTPATKLPSSLLRPRPEVAWLLAWDVPHPESNWAHLHSEVCTPPPQVYCPSRQVLFLSLFCWVTPNGSLFAAWAPSSSCGFPSYTLFSGGFYFQSTQYKTCPFGNSLGFFFFFPTTTFSLHFPSKEDVFALMELVVGQATSWGLLCSGCLKALARQVLERGSRNPGVSPSGDISNRSSLGPPAPPHVAPGDF